MYQFFSNPEPILCYLHDDFRKSKICSMGQSIDKLKWFINILFFFNHQYFTVLLHLLIYQTSFLVVFNWLIDISIHLWLKLCRSFRKMKKSKQHFDIGDIYRSSDRKYQKKTLEKNLCIHKRFYMHMVFIPILKKSIFLQAPLTPYSYETLVFFWKFFMAN